MNKVQQKLALPSFLPECSQQVLIQNEDDFRWHHLPKWSGCITAIAFIFYSNISILIFPTSYTPRSSFFYIQPPITKNEFGHTAGNYRSNFRKLG